MSDWRSIDPSAFASMFDARLKSVAVISHPDLLSQSEFDLFQLNAEFRKSTQTISVLDLSEPGIRLLLGRNGSGKSTLLERLGDGIAAYSGKLETRWTFSVPTEELFDQWDSYVKSVTDSWDDGVGWEEYDDIELLERSVRLPILEFLRRHRLEEANISQEESLLFYSLFHRHGPCDYEGRFLVEGERLGPPTSYSPRRGIKTWFIRALRAPSASLLKGTGDSMWFADIQGFLMDSNYFMLNPDRKEQVAEAFSQFFQGIDAIEFGYPAEEDGARFRFLGQRTNPGALSDLLELEKEVSQVRNHEIEWVSPKLSFPLGLFTEPYPGRVGSLWLNASPSFEAHTANSSVGHNLDSLVRRTVIDLRGDVENQLACAWHRIIDNHLKIVLVRETGDLPNPDVVEVKMSQRGSEAVGREHIIVDGFDDLKTFLDELSEDLRELDIGVSGLRAFRPHDGGWTKPGGPKPGGFFRDVDFGRPVQGRIINQNPKLRFMSELDLQWKPSFIDNWLQMSAASQGQRDVILMLLAITSSSVPGAKDFNDHLLLIDEFDQHLHATVTTKFLEIAQRRTKQSGTRAIFSTHSTPTLQHESTRQAPRIYASRTIDGAFSYSQQPPNTREELAADLGVDLLSASTLSRLFVLVEGEHDEEVLKQLLSVGNGNSTVSGIELINARGTWAFEGIWNNVLRYHSAPVLVVHDKRNARLEEALAALKDTAVRGEAEMPRWSDTEFRKMQEEIEQRSRQRRSQSGDDETDKLLGVIKSIFGGRDNRPAAVDILRLTIHGINSPDIIRLLPIDLFLTARQHGSWEGVEKWWKGKHRDRGNTWSKEFKKELGLTAPAVKTAISKITDDWHPELQRVYDAILRLYKSGGPTDPDVVSDFNL